VQTREVLPPSGGKRTTLALFRCPGINIGLLIKGHVYTEQQPVGQLTLGPSQLETIGESTYGYSLDIFYQNPG